MALSSNFIIRPYQFRDRQAVRDLCYETGDKGNSAKSFFADAALFSDLWTSYYTDIEPESTWVAECDGVVAGYLSCCFQENRYVCIQSLYLIPMSLTKAFARGSLFKSYIWNILFSSIWMLLREPTIKFASKNNFKAHLHININSKFRGNDIGWRLLEKLFEKAKELNLYGIKAGVRADNELGIRFFEKHGFYKIEEHPGCYIPGLKNPVIRAVLLGRRFNTI